MVFVKGQTPWNKGIPKPLETRLKISQKRKNQHNSPKTEFKKGIIPWNKGKHVWKDTKHPSLGRKHSKESTYKMSRTKKRLFVEGKLKSPTEDKSLSDLTKLKISLAKKGKPNHKTSETRKRLFAEGKLIPWSKGKNHMQKEKHPLWNKPRPERVRNKISEGLKKWNKTNKSVPWNKGKINVYSAESNRIRSIKSKKLWKNPEFKEKVIRNMLKALFTRPTSLERKLIELIQKYNLTFEYCGNGSVIIGGFNPDFIESGGRKLLIETANRVHHTKNYEKQRYAIFAKYGFRTLTLWWEDFFTDKYGKKIKENWEQTVLNKIKLFSS